MSTVCVNTLQDAQWFYTVQGQRVVFRPGRTVDGK